MFFYMVLTPISTTSGISSTGNTRKYKQIDVYIYQCDIGKTRWFKRIRQESDQILDLQTPLHTLELVCTYVIVTKSHELTHILDLTDTCL